jgi:hypothetical protein
MAKISGKRDLIRKIRKGAAITEVGVSDQCAYEDEDGQLRSAFQQDKTLMRIKFDDGDVMVVEVA